MTIPFVWPISAKQNQDDVMEQDIFKPRADQDYTINYVSGALWPTGVPTARPWSDIDEKVRNEVDGILVLKMAFTEQDLALFPNLKVCVRLTIYRDCILY